MAVAAVVQVVSGFGFALVAAPVLVALTDPVTSVSLLAVLGVSVSVVTLAGGRRRPEVLRREAAVLSAWAAPGLLAGAWLVTHAPDDAIRLAVGLLVLGALLLRHLRGGAQSAPAGPFARGVAGVAAGTLTTSTGLNGPPLVLYLTGRDAGARAVRDTLAALFVVLGLAGLAALAIAGEVTFPGPASALTLPAVVAGGLLGHRVHDRIPERLHDRITTAVLVAAAVTALASAA